MIPAVLGGLAAGGGGALLGHFLNRGGGGSGKVPKAFKKQEKQLKKQVKFGQKQYKQQQKLFEKAFKKYGGEAFMQKPALTGEQQGLLDYLSKYGRGRTDLRGVLKESPLYKAGVGELLDLFKTTPEAYQRFKEPIMREFQQEVLPEIANRFAGLGTGATRGSGFQNALAQAGEDLSSKLGALRAGLRESAIGQALGYAQAPIENQLRASQLSLGTDPYINIYRPPTIPGQPSPPSAVVGGGAYRGGSSPGFLGSLAGSLAPALGQGLGQGLAGRALEGLFSPRQPAPLYTGAAYQPPALGNASASVLGRFGFGPLRA